MRNFILFGHGVCLEKNDNFIEDLHFLLEDFKILIEFLEKKGYHFVSLIDYYKLIYENKNIEEPFVVLTFDDGYKNNKTVLYPYLKEKNIPFTIFVSTYNLLSQDLFPSFYLKLAYKYKRKKISSLFKIEENANFNKFSLFYKNLSFENQLSFINKIKKFFSKDELIDLKQKYKNEEVLNIKDINELIKDKLVTIDSHLHHHLVINKEFDELFFENELLTSKKILKEYFDIESMFFCFPNGNFNHQSINILIKNNYKMAFTTNNLFLDNKVNYMRVPRIALNKKETINRLLKFSLLGNNFIKFIRYIKSNIK